MQVQALGHVVLKVRNLQRSEDFYAGTLGMRVISRLSDPRMTFFTLETTENHHDFALMELGPAAPAPAGDATGPCSRGLQGGELTGGVRPGTKFAR
ncbi:MAG TPA: VOC family protein [Acidimicrobiales bacterium]|nr:VOC family protein [Acidimicrobiales bacterium]